MSRRLDEPARSAKAAVDRHLRIMRQTLLCVTATAFLYTSDAGGTPSVLVSDRDGDVARLRRNDGADIYLDIAQRFRPYCQADGAWRVTLREYAYSVYDQHPDAQAVRPLLAWHWHPGTRDHPHLHIRGESDTVGSLHKLHVPTRRVTFEAVVEFTIADLEVEPARDDWREQLSDATRRVEQHLNWR